MVNYQERSKRTASGGKILKAHKKRKRRIGRYPIETEIGRERKKIIRVRGGNYKIKAYSSNKINVTDPETGKTQRVEITQLKENNASADLERRSILTKGAIVETDLGPVRITSRPGQHGQINGLLLKE